jgi:hypothetical protein
MFFAVEGVEVYVFVIDLFYTAPEPNFSGDTRNRECTQKKRIDLVLHRSQFVSDTFM